MDRFHSKLVFFLASLSKQTQLYTTEPRSLRICNAFIERVPGWNYQLNPLGLFYTNFFQPSWRHQNVCMLYVYVFCFKQSVFYQILVLPYVFCCYANCRYKQAPQKQGKLACGSLGHLRRIKWARVKNWEFPILYVNPVLYFAPCAVFHRFRWGSASNEQRARFSGGTFVS